MMNEQALRDVISYLEELHTLAIRDAREADFNGAMTREAFCDGKSVGLDIALARLYELLGDKQ